MSNSFEQLSTGPRFRDTKSIQENKFIFLILLSVAMTFINFINTDRAVQIDLGVYPSNTKDNSNDALNFSMIELLCNIPNCFFTPLILGYISDFISIKYLLNITSAINLLSTILLYLYFSFGLNQLYILSRIFFYISSEGLQNATFNLIYEYSNMYQLESGYFAIHSIVGYNIPRLLPYITYLIYQNVSGSKEFVQEHSSIMFLTYIIFNAVACILMLFVSKKNHTKENNEEKLDTSFLCARIAPCQKLSFWQAVKFIILNHKNFSLQCLLGGVLVGLTCFYFQSNVLIQSMVRTVNSDLVLEVNFSTKGFTQISSIIFLYAIGKRMDKINKQFKFFLLWYCIIGLTILCIFLNIIFFVENKIVINIIVYIFLFGIGLQYYCSFMASNSIIYWYNEWFQRGMGYGLFSCSFNTFQTLSGFTSYYLVENHSVEICVFMMVFLIALIIIYDYLQINNIKLRDEKEKQSLQQISFKINISEA